MLDYYITIGVNLLTFVLYIIILFILFETKTRINEKITPTMTYLILSVFCMMIVRILDILITAEIISISYLKEFFIIFFSVFLLLAAIDFYRFLSLYTNGDYKKEGKEKKIKKQRKRGIESRFTKKRGEKINYYKILERINRENLKHGEERLSNIRTNKKIKSPKRKSKNRIISGYLDLTERRPI